MPNPSHLEAVDPVWLVLQEQKQMYCIKVIMIKFFRYLFMEMLPLPDRELFMKFCRCADLKDIIPEEPFIL